MTVSVVVVISTASISASSINVLSQAMWASGLGRHPDRWADAIGGVGILLKDHQLAVTARVAAEDATLILTGARVWTADADQPRAEAVAVAGEKILAVGRAETVLEHRGANTWVASSTASWAIPPPASTNPTCIRACVDPFSVRLDEIRDLEVVMTMVGGEIVFSDLLNHMGLRAAATK